MGCWGGVGWAVPPACPDALCWWPDGQLIATCALPPSHHGVCLPVVNLTHCLQELLNKKDMVGDVFNQLRLARQRGLNQTGVVRPRLQSMPPCSLPLAYDSGKQAAGALGTLLATALTRHGCFQPCHCRPCRTLCPPHPADRLLLAPPSSRCLCTSTWAPRHPWMTSRR